MLSGSLSSDPVPLRVLYRGKAKTMSKSSKAKKPDTTVAGRPGEAGQQALARAALRPTCLAALTVRDYSAGFPDLDLGGLVDGLADQVALAKTGDLSRGEAMLVSQAHTLDAIFHTCARRAASNMGEHLPAAETYLRLAFKAQSQCRMTWETLAEIKNPRTVAFVHQANMTTGPQQINNGTVPEQRSRARETVNEPNKLLEATYGERLDPGTAGTAGGANTHLATVGAIHRPKDTGG